MIGFYLKQAMIIPGARPFEENDFDDAGYDIFSTTALMIAPLSTGVIRTGIATEFAKGFVGLILDRSGMGFKGSIRRAGVIDSSFRGEWQVCLYNSGTEILVVESVFENPKAKACAQVVFVPYAKVTSQIVPFESLSQSKRGGNWLGSSDKV